MTRLFSHGQLVLVGATVVLLAASIAYGWAYLNALDQRAELQTQLATLEQSLSQLQESWATPGPTGPAFPPNPPSVDIMDLVVASATEANIPIAGLSASSLGTEQIGSNTYRTAKLAVRLRASPEQLTAFFAKLESEAPETMIINSLQVNQADATWDVALEVIVYAQPG